MWQKCPICNGSGNAFDIITNQPFRVCPTCNGTKIISTLTGLPPDKKQNNNFDPKLTDFRDGNMESQQEYFGDK